MILYTWKDVENILLSREGREKWNVSWKKILVYPDEVVIYKEQLEEDAKDAGCLNDIFGKHYHSEDNYIVLDIFETKMAITYEEMDEWEEVDNREVPLFRDMFLKDTTQDYKGSREFSGRPIIAFHSYKGGVGRTLSLVSLLKEISNIYGNKRKVLIVDSDLEAPGLTWVLEKEAQFSMSYLDLLSILGVYGDTQETIEGVAKIMQEDIIYLNADKERVRHYFLPAYLKEEQMVTMMPRIDSLLNASDNAYFLTDVISKLGKALGADLIIVDLRAGVSNISAPFLFDVRVQKYFVSSTSLQSIKGTQFVENLVYSKSPLSIANAKILLTMVPKELGEDAKQRIMDQLTQIPELVNDGVNETYLREEYAFEIGFENSLLGLGDFDDICTALQGTKLSQTMNSIAASLFKEKEDAVYEMEEHTIRKALKNLHEYVNITAEASDDTDILITDSISKIISKHRTSLPNLVVLGAKGAGKTYLYRQFVQKRNWNNFARDHYDVEMAFSNDAAFIPILATVNDNKVFPLISSCIEGTNEYLGDQILDSTSFEALREKLYDRLRTNNRSDWVSFWESQILGLFGNRFDDLHELNTYLDYTEKNIIFLFDGLDDLFNVTESSDVINIAIQTLCQEFVRRINSMKDRHIGMIIFVRRDIAEEAMPYNFQQFRDQYKDFELSWSQTEALRLALWVSGKAIPELMPQEGIQTLVREDIEKRLELLWGKKLGNDNSKEAVSARWILAALSDLKGQLQARDIVRFLYYATDNSESIVLKFRNRYIMPQAIRAAIEPCAKNKINEIKTEMKTIYNIFEKFKEVNPEERKLPMRLDKIALTVEELTKLEEQGFIKIEDKQYYLPEIIRQALGYQYRSGARPKVLSLLVK